MEEHIYRNINDYYNLDEYKSLKGKEAVEQRIKGRLPIMDIAGHPFFVDVRLGLLRPWDDFSTRGINISQMPMDDKTKKLSFDYHPPTKTQAFVSDDMNELSKNVVRVTIPNMYYLDPIGMAIRNDKPHRYYLRDGIPLKMYRIAKVMALEKTELAGKIKTNQAALPNESHLKQEKKKNKHIKRR